MRILKKVAKWTALGGLVGGAYGLGRMNPPRSAGRFQKWVQKGLR